MRIDEFWKGRTRPTVSFEIFPARTEKGADNLLKAIDKLAAIEPDFISVTFGAGGSTREGSYQLVEMLTKTKGIRVLPYFAGFGIGPNEVRSIVGKYAKLGIESLLAVRGDPPEDAEGFSPHADAFSHGSDLISFLKKEFDLCLGAAGYPEGHVACESKQKDLEFLKLKVESGASFVIANYFYDNAYFFDFVDRARAIGITVPIVPGVMPIYNLKMMESLAALCGATVTDEIKSAIAALPEGDTEALNDFGVKFAIEQCRGLIAKGVPGLHLYTMDRSKSVVAVVSKLKEEGLLS